MAYKEYITINLSYSILCRVKLKGSLPGYTGETMKIIIRRRRVRM